MNLSQLKEGFRNKVPRLALLSKQILSLVSQLMLTSLLIHHRWLAISQEGQESIDTQGVPAVHIAVSHLMAGLRTAKGQLEASAVCRQEPSSPMLGKLLIRLVALLR